MDNRAGNFRRDTLYIRTRSDLDNSHDVYFLMTQLARSSFVYTHTHTHTYVRIYISRIYNFEKEAQYGFSYRFWGQLCYAHDDRSRKRGLPFRACITYPPIRTANRNQRLRNHSGERYVRLTCVTLL